MTTKTTPLKYNKDQLHDVSKLLKAMAHPDRLTIVRLLETQKTLTVTEIYVRLKMEQAVVSHHLTILKSAGVLAAKKEGKTSHYTLASAKVISLLAAVFKLVKL
jgi:ArsR family transcriptional regulator, virulence genes transcriptional regulator